jgi:Domain of unknown function (DUF1707)/Domain of unknown function (DUF4190)
VSDVYGLPGAGPGYDGMRASDADRNRAVDVLKAAFTEGRLTQEELAWRESRVLAARTYGELAALTADLPAGPLGAFPPPAPLPPRYPYPPNSYQQAYPPAPYAPGYGPLVPAKKTNGMAIAALVAPFFPFLFLVGPVAAVVCGHIALEQIDKTGESGRGMAVAGLILGYLEVAVTILIIMLGVLHGGN